MKAVDPDLVIRIKKGPLPREALAAELLVGFLDRERAAGEAWSALPFNAAAATYYAQHRLEEACAVTDDDLPRVRDKRRELFAQWAALPASGTLELWFTGRGGETMSDGSRYPYATHLNIYYAPLERIDVQALVEACTDQWYNQTLCRVNDSVVRLGVLQGEYHWHKHDDEDEFFYVVEGRFLIDLEGRTVELAPRQGFVVPKGVVHRTRAPERTVILMVEGAGIVPTGD